MSADIMPCGCEGHMDNRELCEYPALLAEKERLENLLSRSKAALNAWGRWKAQDAHSREKGRPDEERVEALLGDAICMNWATLEAIQEYEKEKK